VQLAASVQSPQFPVSVSQNPDVVSQVVFVVQAIVSQEEKTPYASIVHNLSLVHELVVRSVGVQFV
jgi:hypothetical protein